MATSLPASSTEAPNKRNTPGAAGDAKTNSTGRTQCACSSWGRNLVVCIDGTANQFSKKNSNVIELYSRLVKDKDQLTYYNSGIGTYVKDSKSWFSLRAWKQSFDHAIDEAVAWNFKKRVFSAYQWLSENYVKGDRIFLFGFSRGAYQIRVIAGMIKLVGLLYKGNNDQIPFAYELYTESISNDHQEDLEDLCGNFKRTLSQPNVKVHFVGAWDTVSSVGIFRGRSLPETNTGMNHVCFFRHALALDELRVKFLPEYANGGAGSNSNANHIKEVWFAGSHSDIGGGNNPNLQSNLFGPALRWMSYEAMYYGLKMQPYEGEWSQMKPTDSMTLFWKILEYIPLSRLSYQTADSIEWWPPHREHPRQVQKGQLIHESVLDEMTKEYKPKARIYDTEIVWDKAALMTQMMTEKDPYAQASHLFSRLSKVEWATSEILDADLDVLRTLVSSEIGRRSIINVPEAPEILINSLYPECRRLDGNSDLQPRQSFKASIDALAVFCLSPPGVIEHVDNKLFTFSLAVKSLKIQEAVVQLRRRLVGNIQAEKKPEFEGVHCIHWHDSRRKRPISSVILNPGVKELLLSDIKDFFASEQWYAEREIPFRRGYLLHGVPGSGKTSVIHAIAGELMLDIYTFSLSSSWISESTLSKLMSHISMPSIVLLEDLDTAFMPSVTRDQASNGYSGGNISGEDVNTLNVRVLLNLLDSVVGRIVFVTTNHLERLDPALARPGRMDIWVEFRNASKLQAEALFHNFFSSTDENNPVLDGGPEGVDLGVDLGGPAPPVQSPPTSPGSISASDLPSSPFSSPSVPGPEGFGAKNQASMPLAAEELIAANHSVKPLDGAALAIFAKIFADSIPHEEFSCAALKGYLLKYMSQPEAAAANAADWVISERNMREQL